MAKFSALSIQDLMTAERNAGRVARKARFIVAVEVDDGSWVDLDADDQGHAAALARAWVDGMGSRGASCWRVASDGSLLGKPFHTRYAQPIYED